MHRLLSIVLLVLIVSPAFAHRDPRATCYGDDPCRACKNCKYGKHCAKEGGKCGVCKPKTKETPKPKPKPRSVGKG